MEWVAGFVIAVLMGLTGLGAGTFTVPLLLLAGLPAAEAAGTTMIFAGALRLIVAPVYIARGHVHLKYLGWMLIGAVPGLFAGAWALHAMDSSRRPEALLSIGLMLTLSSAASLVQRWRWPHFAQRNKGWLGVLGLPIGIETGFTSAGAGALATILLFNFSEMPAAQVVGTNILLGTILAVLGGVLHGIWGSIQTAFLLHLLIAGVPGALLGCFFSKHIAGAKLRFALAVVSAALGLQLVWLSARNLKERVRPATSVFSTRSTVNHYFDKGRSRFEADGSAEASPHRRSLF